MHPFSYHAATSLDDAALRLAAPGTAPLGGGTDLLVALEEGIAQPATLVDLRRAGPDVTDIRALNDGGLRIGAAARVADVAVHPAVRERFPTLAEAAASVGSYALRAMGTIGGNLCQRPRCWYFRRNIPCLKNGRGDDCPAREGENQYHAVLDGGPCWIVHPSDPAVALTALDATIEISGARGGRTVPIGEFYVLPTDRVDGETVLEAGEFVSAIVLPADAAGGVQRYYKVMQRGAWDFALVSLAAVRRAAGDGTVRLVLGGVAPRPYRLYGSIEEDVSVGNLDEADVETLAARALYDAEPLARNGYKVEVAASLLRRAMRELWAGDDGPGARP